MKIRNSLATFVNHHKIYRSNNQRFIFKLSRLQIMFIFDVVKNAAHKFMGLLCKRVNILSRTI